MIRIRSYATQGGPFPGRGAAPEMKHDKVLPRGQRAGFEALNDAAAMRPTITDAGSLLAANDNEPARASTQIWSSKELRLTKGQAAFLGARRNSIHQRVDDRTQLILETRKMFGPWKPNGDGTYYLPLSAKGEAALSRYRNRKTRGSK
ncbi:hypothetical protein [Rhizobium sp. BK456]|uniref:hypothetical protein n=1 Tax=Rhizobium sp. BK456 TaxID=2587007 RepID=UPI001615DA09|nr:hypothetical protein [Rhizobium sp. BK456]MBB3523097.1 hypothetical protein [Rhizobium sp. BK456]